MHNTPSGQPEVAIVTTDVDRVKGLMVSELINGGYNMTSSSDLQVSFDRPVDNILATALLGSGYDATPNARIVFSLALIGDIHSPRSR